MQIAVALFLLCLQPGQAPALNLTHTTSFVVYPKDTNHLGTMFGGKTLAEMDRCAGVTARRLLYASKARDAVTVGIDRLQFRRAGRVKDLVFVTGRVTGLGPKTITVQVTVEREAADGRELLAVGAFTFAAYDAGAGRAVEHGLTLPPRR